MNQKIALVTGASSGLGLTTALELVKKDIFVVMLCRNLQRGEIALEQVKKESGRQCAAVMLCDLGSMEDIRRFCDDFINIYPRIDILVNNAGVLNLARAETQDGLEAHFGICHIGHFLLANLLLPHMSNDARIVVVGSVAHKAGQIDFDDLAMKEDYSVSKAYSRAKLCNLLFTKELASRLVGTRITVNCVHPGAVVTNIGHKNRKGRVGVTTLRKIAATLLRPFLKTPKQGSKTALFVATSDECANISGEYFAKCKIAKASPKAADKSLAKKLWEVSEQITNLCGKDNRQT